MLDIKAHYVIIYKLEHVYFLLKSLILSFQFSTLNLSQQLLVTIFGNFFSPLRKKTDERKIILCTLISFHNYLQLINKPVRIELQRKKKK